MAKIYSFLYGIKKKAHALYNQGNFEAALFYYDRAIQQNPTDYWSWQGKGLVFLALEKFWKAIYCNEHAIAIEPEHPAAWNNNAICKWEVGYRKAAIRCYYYSSGLTISSFSQRLFE